MKKIVTLSFFVVALSACQMNAKTSPDVKVRGDGYEVQIKDTNDSLFCPPGQAKKGNC